MKAILTVGCSGSGKTTWAEAQDKTNCFVVSRDNIRWKLTGATGWHEYKFTKAHELAVTNVQRLMLQDCAKAGLDVIVADTNLNKHTIDDLISYLEMLGYEVDFKLFPVTLDQLWERDKHRGNLAVGREVLYKQWLMWLKVSAAKQYVPNYNLQKAVIFDVDGTLAHMNGRGPFEWDKVSSDTVDIVVRQMLWDFQKRGYDIVIMSGRDSVCRDETWRWCDSNGIIYNFLHMRKEGDMRKDAVIKTELFWEHVAPLYNVVACVDDRPAMVRAWYDLGIPKVISVGNPWVEF